MHLFRKFCVKTLFLLLENWKWSDTQSVLFVRWIVYQTVLICYSPTQY